jgi:hypothetical protein
MSCPSSPNTVHAVSSIFGDTPARGGKGVQPAHAANEVCSSSDGTSDLGQSSLEGDNSSGKTGSYGTTDLGECSVKGEENAEKAKPGQFGGGKGAARAVENVSVQMNSVILRFANQSVEAAYVAAVNAKLMKVRRCHSVKICLLEANL